MVTIGGYEIDVALTEDHSFEADVTENPVESGAAMTDHVIPRPVRLSLDCVVSNTPFGPLAERRQEFAIIDGEAFAMPADEAFAYLLRIYEDREPVEVVTPIRRYENMVLERLGVPRTSRTGDTLEFRAEFIQVTIRTNERTTVRVAVPKAKRKVNLGHKASEIKGDPLPAYLLRDPTPKVGANANGRGLVPNDGAFFRGGGAGGDF